MEADNFVEMDLNSGEHSVLVTIVKKNGKRPTEIIEELKSKLNDKK